MPVYIRTGELDIPAPSISTVDSDDESGVFVLDPEQVIDELPQPFRMIDKLLTELIDSSWDEIVRSEKEREAEAKKIRPPVYQATSTVTECASRTTTICHSDDSRYMFVAFETGGITAFDAENYSRIAEWTNADSNTCIEHMTCSVIGPNVHLLATIDDLGFARLLVFANDTFYLILLLNEQPEGSAKSNAKKFDLSKHGDFCASALECDGAAWVDVYRLPRDIWLREIETAQKDALKRAHASNEVLDDSENGGEVPETTSAEAFDVKFSAITLTLKVRSPPALTGSNVQNHQEAMEKAGLPNTVGNGTCHLFTNYHLETRRALTRKIHEEQLQYYEPETPALSIPSWHFLNASRMQPETMVPSPGSETTPVSICVWWSGSYIMQTYPLQSKNTKETELKPDIVWPLCGVITSSTTSVCTNILAYGLKNGLVGVMDRHLCIPRAMLSVGKGVVVQDIFVLDGSITSSTTTCTNPPPLYCLIGLNNGSILLLNCETKLHKTLVPSADDADERYSLLMPLTEMPRVFLWASGVGKARLHDIQTGNVICEIALSESLEPPKTRLHFSADGGILYVRDDDDTVQSFCLRSFPSLDEYRQRQTAKQPLVFIESIAERCQNLLTQRTLRQSKRTESLATRWRVMNRELSVLLSLKPTRTPATTTSTPLSRWNQTTGKVLAHNRALTH